MVRRSTDANKNRAIVKAAKKLFMKNGFAETSMDAIASKSGVTKQTIYTHFGSKDNLFSEVVKEECMSHSPSEDILNDAGKNPSDTLFHIGRGFLSMITSKDGLAIHRLVMAESQRRPKIAEIFYESGPVRMQDMLTEYLDLQHKNKNLYVPNAESAASYFYSMLKGRYHLRMALKVGKKPSKKELEDHAKETVRIFLKLYSEK